MMNEQQYAVQAGGKEIRKRRRREAEVEKEKKPRCYDVAAVPRGVTCAGRVTVPLVCVSRLSLSCISLHTHKCTVDMRDAVQAILRLLYMHVSMHQALHGSPVAI